MHYDFDTIIDRSSTFSIKWDTSSLPEDCRDAIPLWVADMDFACPPEVVSAIQKRASHPIYGYTNRSADYYSSLITWMRRRNGWDIRREWVRFAPGVVPALNLAVLAYTQPGDKIIIQPPVYYPFAEAVRNNGRQMVENPLRLQGGYYEMDFDDLERKIDARTRLLVLCSPHNPVGRVWSRGELERLVDICASRGIIIVSDEIHSDIILGEARHRCTASLSEKAADITVTLTAPNKTFNLAGLQIANIIIPNQRLRHEFSQQSANLGLGLSNIFGIAAQEAAYGQGEPWLEALLGYLRENYLTLTRFLEQRLPSIRALPLEGTYLPWLDCRDLGLSDGQLHELFLKEAKLWLDDGTMFGTGGSGFMRLNIASPRSVLTRALERLEGALTTQSRARPRVRGD